MTVKLEAKRTMRVRYSLFSYGGVCPDTAHSISTTALHAGLLGVSFLPIRVTPDPYLGRSRSRTLGIFMQLCDDEVLLMIDRDMKIHDPDHLLNLCWSAFNLAAPVGAIASKRRFGQGLAGSPVDWEQLNLDDRNALPVEATIVGTGIIAIPRQCIAQVEPAAVEYNKEFREVVNIQDYEMSPVLISETNEEGGAFSFYDWFAPFRAYRPERDSWSMISTDAAFSIRMRHWGQKIYVTAKYDVGHIGEYEFRCKDGVKYAVQIGSAAQVDVCQQARDGEGMGEGDT